MSSVVTTNAGDSGFDIADNGQVVWSDKDSYNIYAYLSGVTSQITSTTDKKNLSPLTDGSSILFARVSASASLPVQLVVSFKDPYTGAAKESAFYTSDKAMVPNVDYAIHRGEVYYHFKNSGSDKIFIFWINAERCGCEGSVPDQGDSIGSILSISPGGHLIYSTANNVYYYPRPNGHNIKSSLPIDPEAKIFWSGNDPYASEGGTLYQIVIGINDNVPPVTTINGTDGQWTNTRSFTFTATDDSSGVMWTYLTFLDMDHSSSVINVPRDGNKFTFQADGHYRVVYQSRDWSGNMDDEKGIDLWVDATVPVTTYTTAPIYASDKGATYIKGYTVTLNASDNMSGVKQTFYRINNGAWKLYTAPFELSGTSNMSLDFYSVDNAGNVEAY
jgi:hypothetical protein